MKNCCSLRFSTTGIVVGLFYSTISLLTTILGIEYLFDFVAETNLQHPPSWLIETTSLILVFSLTGLTSSILLVLGTVRKRHLLLLPWLVFAIGIILFISLILCYTIYVLFDIICNKRRFDYSVFIVVLTTSTLLAFQIYLWKCIQLLYKQIRTESEELQQRELVLENSFPLYRKSVDFATTPEI